jgi:hypothetical protein
MKDKIKILANSKRSVNSENIDEYIFLELRRKEKDIFTNSFNNVFNLEDQFEKERNNSLKFCIYGTVESAYADCTDLTLEIKINDNDVIFYRDLNHYTATTFFINTFPLSESNSLSKNVFSKAKASYFLLFEIDENLLNRDRSNKLATKSIKISVKDYAKKLIDDFEVPFLFYDENGNRLTFGQEFVDILSDGTVVEVTNDFPFLYDRHWIKFNISPNKLRTVSIPNGGIYRISENIGRFFIDVELDFPSKNGNEQIDVVLSNNNTVAEPNIDFSFSSQTISWNIGEKTKQFSVDLIDDFFVETAPDYLTFKLINPLNTIVNDNKHTAIVQILDDDIKSKVTFKINSVVVTEGNYLLQIELVLDRPILVENQTVTVEIDQTQTTAVLSGDYRLGFPESPYLKVVYFPLGATSVFFDLEIIDDISYELDKVIVLKLSVDPSNQNVQVGYPPNDIMKIVLKDSLVKKYSTFALPISNFLGDGLIAVNRRTDDVQEYDFYLSNRISWPNFRNDVSFEIIVINKGIPVFSGNTKTDTNSIYLRKSYSSQTETVYIDLPSNFDYNNVNGHYYNKAKYDIFVVPNQFYNNPVSGDWTLLDYQRNQLVRAKFEMESDAGEIGEKIYYPITELKNINIGYDQNTNSCVTPLDETFIFNLNTANLTYFNGIAFIPEWNYGSFDVQYNNIFNTAYTRVNYFLSNKRISYKCGYNKIENTSYIKSTLPFGDYYVPDAIQEKFATLNFRQIAIQAGIANSTLFLEEATQNSNISQNKFFTNNNINQNTIDNIKLKITNLGERSVTILGQIVFAGNSIVIDNINNQLLNNFSIDVPSNYSYDQTSGTFEKAVYDISFENIYFYTVNGVKINQLAESFYLTRTNLIANTSINGIPYYVLKSKFDNIKASNTCDTSNIILGNYMLKGCLIPKNLFPNLITIDYVEFVSVNDDFSEECNILIPHKKV